MRFDRISFTPIAHLRFDLAEISVMRRMAEAHYDLKCKRLADQDKPGLLIKLYNFTRNTRGDSTPAFYKFTWDDIDTLAKTCEGAQYLHTEKQREIGFDLGWRFHQILRAMRENRAETVQIDESKLPGPWKFTEDPPSPVAIAAVGATMQLFNTGTVLEDSEGREVTSLTPSEDGTQLIAEFDHDDAEGYTVAAAELRPRKK